ncbi:glycoside hydrolase family 18 [Pedobacter arcticus]|uniref:glycoside hydrolase family 18 n=1 Tax=Pedobacter arcticus TaxID=752140 RepID=UPI0002F672D8|nr:glycoside hydrolase family 18 [Pedobacter arcticus]
MKQVLQRSDDYYANLRAYKKTDHQIFYGWFGGTGGEGNAEVPGVLDQIPDSVDIVSLWGGIPPMGSYNHNVIKNTQKLKGTRFLKVSFPQGVKDFAGPGFEDKYMGKSEAELDTGIELLAKSLSDTINKFNLDGFDLDYEGGEILGAQANTIKFIKAVSKYLGPKSGTGKLLVMDSYVEVLPAEVVPYLDYYVVQAYSPQGGTVAKLQSRFGQAPGMPFSKCIAAENFEALWATGGLLAAYAAWNPSGGRKGGVAAYHPEYEYPLNPDYKYTRQAIQIMNPAVR